MTERLPRLLTLNTSELFAGGVVLSAPYDPDDETKREHAWENVIRRVIRLPPHDGYFFGSATVAGTTGMDESAPLRVVKPRATTHAETASHRL